MPLNAPSGQVFRHLKAPIVGSLCYNILVALQRLTVEH